MENRIEIEYKNIRFSVKSDIQIVIIDADPKVMCPSVEKMLQTICHRTLSSFASMKVEEKYSCILTGENINNIRIDSKYKRAKSNLTQNSIEHKNKLVVKYTYFEIELPTSLSPACLPDHNDITNLMTQEVNSFMDVVTSYKDNDKYTAYFYNFEKKYVWTMKSEECPMGTTCQEIELCNN